MPSTNDFLSKPLIAINEGKNCGIVTNMLFDSDLKVVSHILVFDQIKSTYNILPVAKIRKMSYDAVTIDDSTDITEYVGDVFNPINFDVFDTNGLHLGIVSEIILSSNFSVKSIECNGLHLSPKLVFSHSNDTLVVKAAPTPKKPKLIKEPAPTSPVPTTLSSEPTASSPALSRIVVSTGAFLIGRKTDKSILDRYSETIIKQGSTITTDILRKAKLNGKLLELSIHAVK